MGSDARGCAHSERMRKGQRVQCWKKSERGRETCHVSVNGEHSVREPLSNNSPVGQSHARYVRKRKSHKPLFMLIERAGYIDVSLAHRRFYMPGAVNRKPNQAPGLSKSIISLQGSF